MVHENHHFGTLRCRRVGAVHCIKSGSRGATGRMRFTFRRAKPDAGNPHVRFDERGGETGPRQARLRRRRESAGHCHRKPTATAPLLDSTSIHSFRDWRFAYTRTGKARTAATMKGHRRELWAPMTKRQVGWHVGAGEICRCGLPSFMRFPSRNTRGIWSSGDEAHTIAPKSSVAGNPWDLVWQGTIDRS